jgi:hypothetical protein
VELVERQVLERGQQAELRFINPLEQGAPLPADRAIADPDVVEIGLDFEADPAAMTGTLVLPVHAADASRSRRQIASFQ